MRFTLLSQGVFRNAEDALGGTIGYHEAGYLLLSRTPEQAEAFRSNVAMQRGLGVDSKLARGGRDRSTLAVATHRKDVAGVWCPTDGIFDQLAFMRLLAARAVDAGATIREGVTGPTPAGRGRAGDRGRDA